MERLARLSRDWRVLVLGFFLGLAALRLLAVAGVVPHWMVLAVLLLAQGLFVVFIVTMLISRSRS